MANLMKAAGPIFTSTLFQPLGDALLTLLRGLSDEAWLLPTVCGDWTVRDVAAHLLGGSLGRLSGELNSAETQLTPALTLFNQLPPPDASLAQYDGLVAWVNKRNARWIELSRDFQTAQLIDWLAISDPLLTDHFNSRDPHDNATFSVAWAGEVTSTHWLDTAREFTEKWHHQQHIRDAVQQPGAIGLTYLAPVMDTFMRALPHVYAQTSAPVGTTIVTMIKGVGSWTLIRQVEQWQLFNGEAAAATASIELGADLAWRMFTGDASPKQSHAQSILSGNLDMASPLFTARAILI